jgi:hypothetical protein
MIPVDVGYSVARFTMDGGFERRSSLQLPAAARWGLESSNSGHLPRDLFPEEDTLHAVRAALPVKYVVVSFCLAASATQIDTRRR